MGAGASGTDTHNPRQFEDIIFEYAGLKKKSNNRVYRVKFSAFVTNFQDSFTQSWNATSVYGKPDAIETYQNTRRVIALAWDVPSNGPVEGYGNLVKLEALIKMLYPVYKTPHNVSTIQSPPLLRLKFANLIQRADVPTMGLLGHTQGFTFAPDLNAGFYNTTVPFQTPDPNGSGKPVAFPKGYKGLIPKTYKMNCQFVVLHEHDLGFNEQGDFSTNLDNNNSPNEESPFPYGAWTVKSDLAAINKLNEKAISDFVPQKTAEEAKKGVAAQQTKKVLGSNT